MSSKTSLLFIWGLQIAIGFSLMSCGKNGNTFESKTADEELVNGEVSRKKRERPSPLAVEKTLIKNTSISIEYSQPAVKGREIWGKLVKFDKLWRTGANEANIFVTDGPITINGDTLEAGKYSLFTIPSREEWVVIFNTVYDQWGAYDYDRKEDAMRHIVRPKYVNELQERMQFGLDSSGRFTFGWEHLRFELAIQAIND